MAKNWQEELERDNAVLRQALKRICNEVTGDEDFSADDVVEIAEAALNQTAAVPVVPVVEAEALATALEAVVKCCEGIHTGTEPGRAALTAYRARHPKAGGR